MTIDQIYRLINYIAKKNNSAFNKSADFNLYINRAQMTKFMQMYGNPHEYVPGQPIPKVSFEVTEKVIDDLKQFIKDSHIFIDNNGHGPYPSDYIHRVALGHEVPVIQSDNSVANEPKEITLKQHNNIWYRRSSNVVPPTAARAIAVHKNTYFQFYPTSLQYADLSYLRQPRDMVWAFTTPNNREEYDPINSVDPEWPDVDINDIISIALAYVGASIKSSEISQYAAAYDKEGR